MGLIKAGMTAILLTLMMIGSLTACGGDKQEKTSGLRQKEPAPLQGNHSVLLRLMHPLSRKRISSQQNAGQSESTDHKKSI